MSAAGNQQVLWFRVRVGDDAGAVRRVLLLYRETAVSTWTAVELPLDPATGRAAAFLPPAGGPIEYVVQAVDASGIGRMVAVCDDGAGAWQTASLVRVGTAFWTGTCPAGTVRSFVQVVDNAGNLAHTDWLFPQSPPLPHSSRQ